MNALARYYFRRVETKDWDLFAEDLRIPVKKMVEIRQKMADLVADAISPVQQNLPKEGQQQLNAIVNDMQSRLKIASG